MSIEDKTPQTPLSLSGPDLFSAIKAMAQASKEKKALTAKTKAGTSTKADRQSLARSLSRSRAIEDMIAQAAANARAKVTPWEPQAVVLPVIRQYCHECHAIHTYTGGAPSVRFKHKRTGTIWETSGHPSQQNPNLPRVVRYLDQEVEICHECFTLSPHVEEAGSSQFLLPLHFVDKKLNIPPTEETIEMIEKKLTPPIHLVPFSSLWPELPYGKDPDEEPPYFLFLPPTNP